MTVDRRLEALLTDWLAEDATEQDAGLVHARAMVAVRSSRPRSAWRVALGGGALYHVARPMWQLRRPVVYLLLVLGLALALVAAAVVGGRLLSVRVPAYGPAENGTLSFSADGDIWVVDPDGMNRRPLIAGPAEDGWPLYSPDGTRFIFDRTIEDGRHVVMVADADGTNPHQVAVVPDPLTWTWTDWAPDSESLVVIWAGDDGRPSLAVLHVDGSPPTPLDLGDLVPREMASWRPPDGQEIVFEADPVSGDGLRGLYAIKPDGTGLRQIGELGYDPECECSFQQPGLSPLGDSIAYSNFEANEARVNGTYLHLRDLTSGADQTISLDPRWPGGGALPRFTPDGASLVFESIPHPDSPGTRDRPGPNAQLVVAPLDRSVPARPLGFSYVGNDGGELESFDISPDGRTVIQDVAGITWLIDIGTGKATLAPVYLPNQPSWQRR